MEQKTLYVEFDERMKVVEDALGIIATTFGLNVVSQAMSATGEEADFALTDSIRVAMRLHAETEATRIPHRVYASDQV